MKTLFSFQSLKAWIAGILVFFASAAQASATGHGHISSTDWWYIGAATVTMIATVYGVGNTPPPQSVVTEAKTPILPTPAGAAGPIQGPRTFSPSISEGIPRPSDTGGVNGN